MYRGIRRISCGIARTRLPRSVASHAPGASSFKEAYKRDGYAIIRNAVDAELLGEMRDHVAWLSSRSFLQGVPPDHWHHPIMRNDPFWVRLISDDSLLDYVQELIGPNIALFSSHYFNKMPKSTREVMWHQDGSYYPLWPMRVVSLWLAVDRSDEANGCVRVVKGSHRTELQEPGGANGMAAMGTHSEQDAVRLGEVLPLELDPGDASLHHPNLVHGSSANSSNRRRCGLSVRYMASDVHCLIEEQPVLLLRGSAPAFVNWYRSWPKYRAGYDMAFRGCEAWNEIRYKDAKDEAQYFSRTDYHQMEAEIRAELDGFVHEVKDL